MARYRFYNIAGDEHISGATDVECRNDADALEKARTMPGAGDIEIWDGARRLARVEANSGMRLPLRSAGNPPAR
jgi:hypothetical protein